MNNGGVESSNEGSQSGGNARAAAEGGSQSGKAAAAASYSGVVAQRVLYGSYKRRVGGKRMGSKSPSRLSKVSAADSNNA